MTAVVTVLFTVLGATFGVLLTWWVARRSKRLLMLLLAVTGGLILGSQAIGDPSALSIALAVWWLTSMSLLLLLGMPWEIGRLDIAGRPAKWLFLLAIYFGVGLSLFGLAVILLSIESVVLWVVASAVLTASLLWNLYALRFLAYGRIPRIEPASGGSALP